MSSIFLVSACLVGFNCKYNGNNNYCEPLVELFKSGMVVPICPEQLGGLPTPREPSKIKGGTGFDVLDGRAQVVTVNTGSNVTENFLRGAREALMAAELLNPRACIMKEKSPSCGVERIYRFESDDLISGMGVTSALLFQKGYKIVSSENLEQIYKYLQEIE